VETRLAKIVNFPSPFVKLTIEAPRSLAARGTQRGMTDPDRRPPVPPALAIFFGILAVSTASIFIRYAQAEAPSLVIAAYRLTLAALLLAPAAAARHRGELASLGRAQLAPALASGFFLALHFATWITSLEYTSVASSVVFVTTTPLWVALLSPLAIKETLNRSIRIGMGLALAGGVFVGLSDACGWTGGGLACPSLGELLRGEAFLGDLLALSGAWMAAGYLLIGRRLRASISLVAYIFVVYGMAALVLVAIMLVAGHPPFGYPPAAYLWFALLALVPQLLGHSTFNWALGYLPAAFVSITLLGEPVGSAILAYFLLGERPTILMIFGAILILAGIYIASLPGKREKRPARETSVNR
jgi:drug/metabolite transporter (DMT)-like permease